MKTTLGWILAAMPLFGIALFYLPPSPDTDRLHKASSRITAQTTHAATSGSAPTSKSAQPVHRIKDGLELGNDLLESRAKVAEALTPELRQQLMEAEMRAREPRYRELFESWNLDPQTSAKILAIISERESLQRNAMLKFYQTGSAGAQEYLNVTKIEAQWAETLLVNLIDHDRYEQLIDADSQIRSNALSQNPKVTKLLHTAAVGEH